MEHDDDDVDDNDTNNAVVNDHHNHAADDDDDNNDTPVRQFLDQLSQLAASSGFTLQHIEVTTERAQYVLEAAAWHVPTAVQLYWDDFLATRALAGQDAHPAAAAEDEEMEDPMQEEEEEEHDHDDADNPAPPVRHVQQQQQQQEPIIRSEDEASVPDAANNNDASIALMLRRRLFPDNNGPNRRRRRRRQGGSNDSIVSNDDDNNIDDNSSAQAMILGPQRSAVNPSNIPNAKRRKVEQKAQEESASSATKIKPDEDDDAGYLSDNDWIWNGAPPRRVRALWSSDKNDTNVRIPSTWIHAGLPVSLSSVATTLRRPDAKDLRYAEWTEQHQHGGIIPPPYHCRSLTVITSIVTAVLYSGAAVLPGPCIGTRRKPLLDRLVDLNELDEGLEPILHPWELNHRLIDAITVLLYIAATTSMQRKQKALDKLFDSTTTAAIPLSKRAELRRRLQLVPVVSSLEGDDENDDDTGETENDVVSFTHINDLRDFVSSHLSSFTKSGGVALLLETIARIHGNGGVGEWPTIHCTCFERFLPTAATHKAAAKQNPQLDTTPKECSCWAKKNADRWYASVLLTGHAPDDPNVDDDDMSWWDTLGIGLLSSTSTPIVPQQTPPIVWLLQGPTQWSVLLHKMDKNEDDSMVRLRHMNTWYTDDTTDPSPTYTGWTDLHVTNRGAVPSTAGIAAPPLRIHPQDQAVYPEQYRLWRYSTEEREDTTDAAAVATQSCWTPFHALSALDRARVEQEVGSPDLLPLLQQRWPSARLTQGNRRIQVIV